MMVALPPWIDPDSWLGFEEMRKAMGKKVPFTDRAQMLIIKELGRLKEAGYDVNSCLDQSTLNGWRGVFPTRDNVIPVNRKAPDKELDRIKTEEAKFAARTPEQIERAKRLLQEARSKIKRVA